MRPFRSDPDTQIGGHRQKFPPTSHSAIIAARSEDHEIRQRGFDTILKNYWKPVYKYIRVKWHSTNEDAKDLTQGFFVDAFEKNHFASYDARKASFQTFLRTCLDGFIANQRKSESRLKRGGKLNHVSLDFVSAEEEISLQSSAEALSAEDFFYQEWVRNLFSSSVDTLRKRLESSGRAMNFQLFEKYDLADAEAGTKPSYASLAYDFAVDTNTVNNRLSAARREFRNVVLETLREITATDEEFRNEARALLGIELK